MCCSRFVTSRSFFPPSLSCRCDSRCAVCTRQELQIWLARSDVIHTTSSTSSSTRCLCLWSEWKWSPPVESVQRQRRNCDCCSVCLLIMFLSMGSLFQFFFNDEGSVSHPSNIKRVVVISPCWKDFLFFACLTPVASDEPKTKKDWCSFTSTSQYLPRNYRFNHE